MQEARLAKKAPPLPLPPPLGKDGGRGGGVERDKAIIILEDVRKMG